MQSVQFMQLVHHSQLVQFSQLTKDFRAAFALDSDPKYLIAAVLLWASIK
jgi:hypothetical protein